MRISVITVSGHVAGEEVIAEPFTIEGSAEKFAVHRSIGDSLNDYERWSATHVETGLSIAYGKTIDDAIARGRLAWLSRTPEEIKEVKDHRAAQIAALRGALQ